MYTSVEIMPELKKNILKIGYGINFKYEGMLAYSFDKFIVVTKFILPSVSDLKFLTVDFDERCNFSMMTSCDITTLMNNVQS